MRKDARLLMLFGSLFALPALACAAFAPRIPDAGPLPTAQGEVTAQDCPDNRGKIVNSYDSMDRSGVNYGLYLMNPDGSDRKLITSPEEIHAMEPTWAPDRCRVAYKSFTKAGNDDIYVITADGESVSQLTTGPAWESSPDWSPQGERISFRSDRTGTWNLFVMNADGSNVQQVTDYTEGIVGWQTWSPAGDEIAFSYDLAAGDGIREGIFGIRPDGTGLHQLVRFDGDNSAVEPAWSPDGNTLYFISNKAGNLDIWAVNSDGTNPRQISDWPDEYEYTHSLRVSPDGTQLVFYGIGPGIEEYREEIWVINTDGSGLKNITLSPGNDQWLDW